MDSFDCWCPVTSHGPGAWRHQHHCGHEGARHIQLPPAADSRPAGAACSRNWSPTSSRPATRFILPGAHSGWRSGYGIPCRCVLPFTPAAPGGSCAAVCSLAAAPRNYLRWVYERFDLVLAPSRTMCDYLRSLGLSRVALQPLGVDAGRVQSVQAPRRPAPRAGYCRVHAPAGLRRPLLGREEHSRAAPGVRQSGSALSPAAGRRRRASATGRRTSPCGPIGATARSWPRCWPRRTR